MTANMIFLEADKVILYHSAINKLEGEGLARLLGGSGTMAESDWEV